MPFVILKKGYAHSHVAAPKKIIIKLSPSFLGVFFVGQETRHFKKPPQLFQERFLHHSFFEKKDEAIADCKHLMSRVL